MNEPQKYMAILTVFAFKRGLNPLVKPHSMEEILEACKSPSVAGIIRLIEARCRIEAEAIASRRVLAGDYEHTFGYPPKEAASPARPSKLELVNQADAKTENAAEAHFKGIALARNAMQRNGTGLVAQMVIAGSHMEALANIFHGDLEKRLAEKFPDLPQQTQWRWRKVSCDFLECVKSKRLTVSLLNAKGRLKSDKKTHNTLLEIIPEIMEGRNVTDFLRDCKLMRQIEEQKGGFKYDKGRLEAWLKENHADLAGKSYEELPPKIQREFAKFELSQRARPEPKPEEEAKQISAALAKGCSSKFAKAYSTQTLLDLKELAQKYIDKLNALIAASKQEEQEGGHE